MRKSKLFWLAVAASCVAAFSASVAIAHYNYVVGTNGNNGGMDGHEHQDEMYGLDGYDDMSGHDDTDLIYGGNQNDYARGQNGPDSPRVHDDSNGGDVAQGGDDYDVCYVNPGDSRSSCNDEIVLQ